MGMILWDFLNFAVLLGERIRHDLGKIFAGIYIYILFIKNFKNKN